MKPPSILLLGLTIATVTFTIQEMRISQVRQKLSQREQQTPPEERIRRPSANEPQLTFRPGKILKKDQSTELESLKSTHIEQGLMISIHGIYGIFITELSLGPDESEYFESLLLERLVAKQQFGANYLNASASNRQDTVETFEIRIAKSDLKIRKFLNHPDDFADFVKYEKQLPERRTLNDIRPLISSLSRETDEELINLLYQCRTKIEGEPQLWETLVPLEDIKTKQEHWEKCDARLAQVLPSTLPDEIVQNFLHQWKIVRNAQKEEYYQTYSLIHN